MLSDSIKFFILDSERYRGDRVDTKWETMNRLSCSRSSWACAYTEIIWKECLAVLWHWERLRKKSISYSKISHFLLNSFRNIKDNIDTGSSKSCEYFKGWMEFVAQCESEELSRLEWAGRSVKKNGGLNLEGFLKLDFSAWATFIVSLLAEIIMMLQRKMQQWPAAIKTNPLY